MVEDSQLISDYVREGSADSFRELVERHAGLVYSAAFRLLGGDAHRAQDITQEVFVLLARKAPALRRHPTLTGWLYTTTHFKVSEANRTERRRRVREQESHAMEITNSPIVPDWDRLRPILDEAMLELGDNDREAVLLRYFQSRPYAEIADRFGVGESAAQKRVDRALDRLRVAFARRGFSSSTAAIGAILTAQAATPVPAGLAIAAGSAALAAGAGSAGLWPGLTAYVISIMSTGNKIALAVAGLSLLGNIVLVGMLALPESQGRPPLATTGPDLSVLPAASPAAKSGESVKAPSGINLTPAQWGEVMALGLPDRLNRLRAMGLPAEVIRRVAIEELYAKYAPRYREIMGADESLAPYWKTEASMSARLVDPERAKALSQYFRDAFAELGGLLGDDAYFALAEEERPAIRTYFGEMPNGKALKFVLDVFDLNAELGRISWNAGSSLSPADRQRMADIQKEIGRVKAEVLTPEELVTANLTAVSPVRSYLAGFNPTEEEYKAIFPLKQEFDAKYGPLLGTMTQAERDRWNAGQQEFLASVSAVVGPDRGTDFKLATSLDGQSGTVSRVVARLGLPLQVTEQVNDERSKALQEVATARRRGPGDTAQTINQRVSQLESGFRDRMTTLLGGSSGFEAYRQTAGLWMNSTFAPLPSSP